MKVGFYLGKPNQLRALLPVAEAAFHRGWTVRWYGPGSREDEPHPRDLPDVTVAVGPPIAPTPWIWLQAGMDPLADPRLATTDATVAVYTEWWAAHLPRTVKSAVVGLPVYPVPTPPENRGALIYLPWSVRSGARSRWHRLTTSWQHRRWLPELRAYVQDWTFHVKLREKDPVPASLLTFADVIVDEEHGKSDTLEWLAGATGCIHMYSSVVLEAAALGVPSLCLDPGGSWGNHFCSNRRYGLFNWPGVVEWRYMTHAFEPPPRWELNPAELALYRQNFVGETAAAAGRVCDLVEKLA